MAMYEVYTGSKPGRPALLLAFAGAALFGSLGLAWLQTLGKLSLGEPQSLDGMPLMVRTPKSWKSVPGEPGVFIQPDDQNQALQRCVIFSYKRNSNFRSPADILKYADKWEWRGDEIRSPRDQAHIARWQILPITNTTLAGWPAIEIRRRRLVQVLTSRQSIDYSYTEDRILRVACHSRGDVIAVEYVPAYEIAEGDLDLMDALCNNISFSDPALRLTGKAAQAAAGVEFPVKDNWTVLGPDHVMAPAVHVLGRDDQGLPAWSVGAYRTWIAGSRSPAEIVADHYFARTSLKIDPARVVEWGRLDQVRVAALITQFHEGTVWRNAIYLLWKPPQHAVLISLDGEMRPESGLLAAEALANTLTFAALPDAPDIDAAEAVGRECAAQLSQKGATPWWYGRAMQAHYLGTSDGEPAAMLLQRKATDGDPKLGFSGQSAYVATGSAYYSRERWAVDGDGVAYQWSLKQGRGDTSLPGMTEFRRPGSNVITRRRGRDEELTFTVGNRFVCPPLAPLAEAWVSRYAAGDCLIDVSTSRTQGVASRLIRRLPIEKTGPPQVIVLDDYWPRGRIAAYDDEPKELQLLFDRGPGYRRERIDAAEAARNELFSRLRVILE